VGEAAPIVSSLLEPAGAAVTPEEAFWAVRKVLEALARRKPLVLVIDDLHWAEPTFVELVEHVVDRVRDAPLLLLIMARPELLDSWPGWGGGKPNATSVLLEPLSRADAADLLVHLAGPAELGERTEERILDVAEGNPLFVEELVAMLADAGGGELPGAVPPTIQALLAARLDRLSDATRAVLEAAAVEGKEFGRARVEWLVESDLRDSVSERLLGLVRTDLIRPVGANDDTFRFRHQLIRDAAYDGIPKERRAVLHERFADWLYEHRASVPSVDELLGHHLERAVLLRRELGAGEAAVADLAARASQSLLRAGRRASAREEPAAKRLLERALALAPGADRPTILAALADALFSDGELLGAAATANEAARLASAAGDGRTAARAKLIELRVTRGHLESDGEMASAKAAAAPLIAEFEQLGDDEGLASALRLMGYLAMERYEEATGYLERSLVHAERADDRLGVSHAAALIGLITVYGPLPVPAALERCRGLRHRVSDLPVTRALLMRHEAVLLAMRGDIDDARALHDEADRTIDDLGNPTMLANTVFTRASVELLAGAPARAESVARASLEAYEAMHNRSQASTAAAFVALALVEQNRDDEALHYADLAAQAVVDDYASQVSQLAVRARVLARRGDLDAAEAAASDAVARSGRSDDPWLRGEALTALAFVLERGGRTEQAAEVLRRALTIYERKGNVVMAGRVGALIGYPSGQTSST
jgi:tetratricopeptide (TPR) repeat protein